MMKTFNKEQILKKIIRKYFVVSYILLFLLHQRMNVTVKSLNTASNSKTI